MGTENNAHLISVIVPVYNVQNYLAQCMDSILAQTHRNLEVILINDGSTDESGTICDSYAETDSRIKVIHQENAGVSAARNAGLDLAQGEWVGFVDPDDWTEPNMYEELLTAALTEDVQMVVCGYNRHLADGRVKHVRLTNAPKVIENTKALEYAFQGSFSSAIWNKLFRRTLIDRVRFNQEIHQGEDRLFLTEAILSYRKSIMYVPEALYNFNVRIGSATHSFSEKRMTGLDAREKIWNMLMPVSKKLSRIARCYIVLCASSLMLWAAYSDKKTYYPIILKRARPHLISCIFAGGVSLRKRILSIMVILFPTLGHLAWKKLWLEL